VRTVRGGAGCARQIQLVRLLIVARTSTGRTVVHKGPQADVRALSTER
jgi:hypothetical protein